MIDPMDTDGKDLLDEFLHPEKGGGTFPTMEEILESLEVRGIHAERKSIYTDIQTLNDFGADIKGEEAEKYLLTVTARHSYEDSL